MDSETLVERQIDDGRKLVEELPQRGFDVLAAMWLKTSDDGKWRFHIISPLVDAAGHLVAYRKLLGALRAMLLFDSSIDPLEIKLLGASNPLAQDVTTALGRIQGRYVSPIIWRGQQLGNVSVEGAYLYAAPAPTP